MVARPTPSYGRNPVSDLFRPMTVRLGGRYCTFPLQLSPNLPGGAGGAPPYWSFGRDRPGRKANTLAKSSLWIVWALSPAIGRSMR